MNFSYQIAPAVDQIDPKSFGQSIQVPQRYLHSKIQKYGVDIAIGDDALPLTLTSYQQILLVGSHLRFGSYDDLFASVALRAAILRLSLPSFSSMKLLR